MKYQQKSNIRQLLSFLLSVSPPPSGRSSCTPSSMDYNPGSENMLFLSSSTRSLPLADILLSLNIWGSTVQYSSYILCLDHLKQNSDKLSLQRAIQVRFKVGHRRENAFYEFLNTTWVGSFAFVPPSVEMLRSLESMFCHCPYLFSENMKSRNFLIQTSNIGRNIRYIRIVLALGQCSVHRFAHRHSYFHFRHFIYASNLSLNPDNLPMQSSRSCF